MPVIPCNVGRFAVRAGDRFSAFDPHRATLATHGRTPSLTDGPAAALIMVAVTDVGRVVEVLEASIVAALRARAVPRHQSPLRDDGRSLPAMIFQSRDETETRSESARSRSRSASSAS